MPVYDLDYVIDSARQHCPYYRDMYRALSQRPKLAELPLIDTNHYWQAAFSDFSQVQSGQSLSGKVVQSGGTTGQPKFSVYTSEEWQTINQLAAKYFSESGIKNGDIMLNGFAPGNLYASYDATSLLHNYSSIPFVMLNSGLFASLQNWVDTMLRFKANVLASVPSRLMQFFEYIKDNRLNGFNIDTIYFAGETMQMAQRAYINSVLRREVEYRSMGYASNDGGYIAYFSHDCGFNEHRILGDAYFFELLDPDSKQVIEEEGVAGDIYVTALYRLQMPIIRYPAGDKGMYSEAPGGPNRKFRLIGRSGSSVRVGATTLTADDMANILNQAGINYKNFQMIVFQENLLDSLKIKIVSQDNKSQEVWEAIIKARPYMGEQLENQRINPVEVLWVTADQMEYNPKTGKLATIVDKRQ